MPDPTPSPPHPHWDAYRSIATVGVSFAVVGSLYLGHVGVAIALVVLAYVVVIR